MCPSSADSLTEHNSMFDYYYVLLFMFVNKYLLLNASQYIWMNLSLCKNYSTVLCHTADCVSRCCPRRQQPPVSATTIGRKHHRKETSSPSRVSQVRDSRTQCMRIDSSFGNHTHTHRHVGRVREEDALTIAARILK